MSRPLPVWSHTRSDRPVARSAHSRGRGLLLSGIRRSVVPVSAAVAESGGRLMPRPLQAALILLHVLFVATLVGAVRALSTASSVDAVDGYLLGLLLYASLPGVTAFSYNFV